MKKRNFTLIELLTVIVIIGVIAGLSGAALMRGREQARRTEARIGAEALRSAISQYEGDYGVLPHTGHESLNHRDLEPGEYDSMIGRLAGDNPRNNRYISTDDGEYRDPWGQRYEVRLDTNYSGTIPNPADSSKTMNRSAAVWSDGNPDREEGPIYPWD